MGESMYSFANSLKTWVSIGTSFQSVRPSIHFRDASFLSSRSQYNGVVDGRQSRTREHGEREGGSRISFEIALDSSRRLHTNPSRRLHTSLLNISVRIDIFSPILRSLALFS